MTSSDKRLVVMSDQFPPLYPGGAQSVACATALACQQAGYDVTVLTTHHPDTTPVCEHQGMTLLSFPFVVGHRHLAGGFADSRVTHEILRAIDRIKPQVVHAHNIHSALGWGWIEKVRKKNIPIMATLHDLMVITQGRLVPPQGTGPDDPYYHSLWQEFRRFRRHYKWGRRRRILRALSHCATITAVSHTQKRYLVDHGVSPITVIYNGIDDDPHPLQPLQEKPTFIFLGRPSDDKGVRVLLDCALQCPIPTHVVLAGEKTRIEGPYGNLIARVRQGGHEVTLTGFVTDTEKMEWIDRSWVTANLSTYVDAFNLTNLEGMIRQRPIFGTRWGGTREVVRDGVDSWVIDPRNTAFAHQTFAEIARSPIEVAQRGVQGRQRILDHFLWANILPRYLDIIDRLLKQATLG